MKKVIWVRHGIVDSDNKNYDTLTEKGKDFSQKLPYILKDEKIDIVYFISTGRTGEYINRCKETIQNIDSDIIEISNNDCLINTLKNSKEFNILICYTNESLKQAIFKNGLLSQDFKEDKSKLDQLYSNIISTVMLDDDSFIQSHTIPTGFRRNR